MPLTLSARTPKHVVVVVFILWSSKSIHTARKTGVKRESNGSQTGVNRESNGSQTGVKRESNGRQI